MAVVDDDGTQPTGEQDERWVGNDAARLGAEPWLVADLDERPAELDAWIAELEERAGYRIHPSAVVATDARIVAERLHVGAGTVIASGCAIRGDVRIGAFCSLNMGASTIGRVTLGDLVRVATQVVLVGENHIFDDPDKPIAVQGLRSVGIVVEDDVWIGAHVTVLDGVTVGAHSVLAAGAVVTRDVPPWSVVAGVPARVIRRRVQPVPPAAAGSASSANAGAGRTPSDPLARFDALVRDQWPAVLERCRVPVDAIADAGEPAPIVAGLGTYVDVPGGGWHPRALNDAVEIAGAFGADLPAGRATLIEVIQGQQDQGTGMFVLPGTQPAERPLHPTHDEWRMYGILSCGYALEVLGAAPAHPVRAVEECDDAATLALLERLDWRELAWPSGSWIDAFGTAAALNQRHHGSTRRHEALWAWLEANNRADSGMWGHHLRDVDERFGWLMAVNGYYRMTRGTYAQFGRPLPRPERAIDTVLAHARANDWFADDERTACNVLDIVHPLWLLGQQTTYRRAEIHDGVASLLTSVTGDWIDGAGFAFHTGHGPPGLQGTEMWLSIVFLAADLLGTSDGLGWRPRGVHRLEPIAR